LRSLARENKGSFCFSLIVGSYLHASSPNFNVLIKFNDAGHEKRATDKGSGLARISQKPDSVKPSLQCIVHTHLRPTPVILRLQPLAAHDRSRIAGKPCAAF